MDRRAQNSGTGSLQLGMPDAIFSDRGAPFDLTQAPEADIHAPLGERRGGGMGIHLVRQIMRDVSYSREGEWNVLTMQHTVEGRQETL